MFVESFMAAGSLSGAQLLYNGPGINHEEDYNNYFKRVLDRAVEKYGTRRNEAAPGKISTGKRDTGEDESLVYKANISTWEKKKEHESKQEDIKVLDFYYLEAINRIVQEMANESNMLANLSAVDKYNLVQEILKELYGNYQNIQAMAEILNNELQGAMNLLGIETGTIMDEFVPALGFDGENIDELQKEVKYKLEELLQKFHLPVGSIVVETKEINELDKAIIFGDQGKLLDIMGRENAEGNGADDVEGFQPGGGSKENEAVNPGDGILNLKKGELELTKESAGKAPGHGEHGDSSKTEDITAMPGFTEKFKNDMDKTWDADDLVYVNYSAGNDEGQKNVISAQGDASPVEVFRNEIIFSIADKAKALASDKQSVIVVNLKPDNLGKVTLRVATESNLVAAKIITENYQVKEIIENNFQMLKDALEKQGLIIHNLSVSVNNGEGDLYSKQDGERFIPGVKSSRMLKNAAAENYQLESQGYADMIFLYDWPYSTINLKA